MKRGRCRGWRLAGDMETLLLAWLCELQGTTSPRVGQDGHSAGLWLVDQCLLIAGSHQAVSAKHQGFAGTLCLPVGRFLCFSPNTLPLLLGWSCLLAQHLWASESGAGWLQPCVHGLDVLYISVPLGLSFLPAHTKAVSGSLRINVISRSAARNNKNNHSVHSFGQCTANRLCV